MRKEIFMALTIFGIFLGCVPMIYAMTSGLFNYKLSDQISIPLFSVCIVSSVFLIIFTLPKVIE
jgi:hypothetical protein